MMPSEDPAPVEVPVARPGQAGRQRDPARAAPMRIVALGLALALSAYLPAIDHAFQFDDEAKIVANPLLERPSAFLRAFGSGGYSEHKGRVLTWLSLALDRRIHGLEPRGFHATSLLLHLGNVLLLYALGNALHRRRGVSPGLGPAFGAALFAVHPLASEAVLYLNARGNLLVTCFALAALLTLLDGRPPWRTPLAALLVLLALLSKEVAVALPVLALLSWSWVRPQPAAPPIEGQRATFPLLAWLLALALVTALASGALGEALRQLPAPERLLGQAQALVIYLGLSLAPLPALLSVEHDFPYPPGSGWILPIASLLALALLAGHAWRRRRQDPIVAVLLLWPLVAHLPTSLFPRREALVEYRAYLPLAGTALLLGLALARRPRLGALALPLLALLTFVRAQVWETPLRLWQDAASKSPGSFRAHNNLGAALENEGRLDEAIVSYQRAAGIDPAQALARYNLGTALVRRGQFAGGIAELRECVRLRPGFARAHHNLGRALLAAGEGAAGRAELERALALDPGLAAGLPGTR